MCLCLLLLCRYTFIGRTRLVVSLEVFQDKELWNTDRMIRMIVSRNESYATLDVNRLLKVRHMMICGDTVAQG